jgi:response regulator RpfG family c-di-GMP phosphodiesterase
MCSLCEEEPTRIRTFSRLGFSFFLFDPINLAVLVKSVTIIKLARQASNKRQEEQEANVIL